MTYGSNTHSRKDYTFRTASGNPVLHRCSTGLSGCTIRFVRSAVVAFSGMCSVFAPCPADAQSLRSALHSGATYLSFIDAPAGGVSNSPFRYVDGQKAPEAGYAKPEPQAREELEIAVEQLRRRQTELEDRIEALERRMIPTAPAGSGR